MYKAMASSTVMVRGAVKLTLGHKVFLADSPSAETLFRGHPRDGMSNAR